MCTTRSAAVFFRIYLLFFYLFLPFLVSASKSPTFDVRDFGAVGDGKHLNTLAIQKAIDQVSASGGGTVVLRRGKYLSGTVELKSHVALWVNKDAVLLGSTRFEDYRRGYWLALIKAAGQEDMAVCGEGVIDGQGGLLASNIARLYEEKKLTENYDLYHHRPMEFDRPQLIEFLHCHRVSVKDITLKDSACWVNTYRDCDHLEMNHVRVQSVSYWNNDGIDIVDCQKVHVVDCDINSADDGICLKSDMPGHSCEDVLVEHCKVRSSASAFKMGTGSYGNFRKIRVHDLAVRDTYRSAVAIECVDGGVLKDVEIGHVRAKNTGNAIFIKLGDRTRGSAFSSLQNIRISDMKVEVPSERPDADYAFPGPEVRAPHNLIPASLTGLPGHPVQNVTLSNITITFGGGGQSSRAHIPLDHLEKVPENAQNYPEFSMFGELPAWGFYCRHVEGIRFQNIKLRLKKPDFRPSIVADDVQGLELNGFKDLSMSTAPVIVLNQTKGATFRNVKWYGRDREWIRETGGCNNIVQLAK